MQPWQIAFKQWQDYAASVRRHADNARRMREDRAYKLAESVGLPRHGLCIHNAAIDDSMTGWCHGNPARLKVAKRVNWMLLQWPESTLADRIIGRAYDRLMQAHKDN